MVSKALKAKLENPLAMRTTRISAYGNERKAAVGSADISPDSHDGCGDQGTHKSPTKPPNLLRLGHLRGNYID